MKKKGRKRKGDKKMGGEGRKEPLPTSIPAFTFDSTYESDVTIVLTCDSRKSNSAAHV